MNFNFRISSLVILLVFPFLLAGQIDQDCIDIGITEQMGFTTIVNSGGNVVNSGDAFCIDFEVVNFDFLIGFQFAFSFDPNQLCYLSTAQTNGALIGPISVNEVFVDNGIVAVIWTNFNAEGQQLDDGTQVFTMCFEACGDPAECAEIYINESIGSIPASNTEVLYQIVEGTACTDNTLTIDGAQSTCIEIDCPDFIIFDINTCVSDVGQGSLNFQVCGGAAPYMYTVMNNNTGITTPPATINNEYDELPSNISNLAAGTYTISVTDSGGGSTSRQITIDNAPGISFTTDNTDPVCPGADNGIIDITSVSGGIPQYDIYFPNGFTYLDVNDASTDRLESGTYQITVVDESGCEYNEDVTLNTEEWNIDIQVDSATCIGANDGSISITILAGATPFPDGTYIINGSPATTLTSNSPFLDPAYDEDDGHYRVRIEDSLGCQRDTNVIIPVRGSIEGIEFSGLTDVVCKGDSTGSIMVTATIPGNYNFNLVDEFGNLRFDIVYGSTPTEALLNGILPAEEYFMRIVDNNTGCTLDTSFTINEPDDQLLIFPDITQPNCGQPNGIAAVNVVGGEMPYDYAWADDPAEMSNALMNVGDGDYAVTITDDVGCQDSLMINLMSDDVLIIDAYITMGLNCDGTGMGELFGEILQSTANSHTYVWTNPMGDVISNLPTAEFTMPGDYEILIEAPSTGCVALATVTVPANSAFTYDLSFENPSCPNATNGTITIDNFSGGVAPYTCMWSDMSITDCMPTGLSAGTYMVTISDDTGCEIDTMIMLEDQPLNFTVDIVVVDVGCSPAMGGSIDVTPVGGIGPFVCMWDDATIMSCNPTGLDEGTYNFTITDDAGCELDTFATILGNPVMITFDQDITNPSCSGGLGSISISNIMGGMAPYEVTWNDPTLLGPDITGLSANDYTASITDDNGCVLDTTFALINQDDSFQPPFISQAPTCINGDDGFISILNCIGCTCEWEDPTLNIQNCDLVGLTQGMYNVTITDPAGCQQDTMIDISVTEGLEIELVNMPIDAECFEVANGQAEAIVTNDPLGIGTFDFFWSSIGDDDSGLSDTAENLAQGQNWVYAFDGFCQSDTLFFTTNEPTKIRLDFDNSVINGTMCRGECDATVMLQGRGGTSASGDYSFEWSDGGSGANRTDVCPGWNYITIIDDNDCMQIDSIFITQPDTLIVQIDSTASTSLNCFGNATGTIKVDAMGGCFDFVYEWPAGVDSDEDTAEDLELGTYVITVTDGCGCAKEVEFDLQGADQIQPTLIDPGVAECFGGTADIGVVDVIGGVPGNYTYSINFGERLAIDSIVEVPIGMYSLTVFDAGGCSETVQVEVAQPDQLIVDLGSDICLDLGETNVVITANVSGNQSDVDFFWSSDSPFECIDSTDCDAISITPSTFATYEVEIVDGNGCTDTDIIQVEIKAQRNVYVPTVFNPDAFPPNDRLMLLTGQGVEEVLFFRIFDRWGNMVYEVENLPAPTNNDSGWDGRRGNNGPNSEVEQGVYVYSAEVRFVDGEIIKYRGGITLLK